LAREGDSSHDELAATLCDDTAVASSGICSTYFDDAEIPIELCPSLH
jgi:hypothetical protein